MRVVGNDIIMWERAMSFARGSGRRWRRRMRVVGIRPFLRVRCLILLRSTILLRAISGGARVPPWRFGKGRDLQVASTAIETKPFPVQNKAI